MLASSIDRLRGEIADHAARAGREPRAIRLLAVTKTQPRSAILEAIDCGLRLFGENRVQEAAEKYGGIRDGIELRLVGHLQSNKARLVPGLFHGVESVDSAKLAAELSRRATEAGVHTDVLFQFNSSGETTKSGYLDESALIEDAHAAASLAGLRVRGVMTIGPFVDDAEPIRRAFERTRRVYEHLRTLLGDERIDTLSMGMSDDFSIAIAEGSTEVRIGTRIFGARG